MAHEANLSKQAFEDLVELSGRKYGSSVMYATDDYFAEKDNLLNPEPAVFLDGKYTHRGKWMDGWESRRKRVAGHDFAIIRLGLPGVVSGVIVDTAFFRGNYPQACSIEGVYLSGNPTVEDLLSPSLIWHEVAPRTDLQGDHRNAIVVENAPLVTHLRLHIYPDGGVARLRVHGHVIAPPRALGRVGFEPEIDLASVELGASVVSCNDMFFGSRHNLISPGRAETMGDGWETKRSRKSAADWAILKLGARGSVHRVLVDTLHFRGNFPESVALDGIDMKPEKDGSCPNPSDSIAVDDSKWTPILARTKLQEHTLHDYEDAVHVGGPFTHVRARIWPDGGISRMRLYGRVAADDKANASLRFINALTKDARACMLHPCAGVATWSNAVAAAAPFLTLEELFVASDKAFALLSREDWLSAFSSHPRIGERKADATAMGEQAKAQADAAAQGDLANKLAELNRAYEAKFGRVFLICATGLPLATIVEEATRRLAGSDEDEFKTACLEHQKICALRLRKLTRRSEG
jgi:allantoicase